MWFNKKTYRVIRQTTKPGFHEAEWTEIGEIIGTFSFLSSMDSRKNNQLFADAKAVIDCDLEYDGIVESGDRLIDPDDNVFRVAAVPLKYDNVLKHIEIGVAEEQSFTEVIVDT